MKKATLANATLASVLSFVLAVGAASAASTDAKVDAKITHQTTERPGVATGVKADDSAAMRDTKEALANADKSMRQGADEIRAFLSGNDPKKPLEPVVIRRDATAEAMLKTDVLDANGNKVATVDDILLDDNGRPTKVIVAQGGVMGVGAKKAAFDYSTVTPTTHDGKRVLQGLSEASIKQAPEAQEPAANTASVREILDGSIVDSKGDKVAAIENVAFNGSNTQLIVKFNDTFGMGGDLAAMNVGSLERVDNNGEVNYRLSDAQSAKFKNYKAAVE